MKIAISLIMVGCLWASSAGAQQSTQQLTLCQAFHLNDVGQWCPVGRITFNTPRGPMSVGFSRAPR